MEFLGDGDAADDGTALEDDGLESRLGEIEGGDQAVVPGANDYDIAFRGHTFSLKSFFIFLADLRG